MKLLIRLLSTFVLAGACVLPGFAEPLPEFRPALLGHHRRSLVNLIDTQALMKRGQGNALVMFSCSINAQGFAGWSRCYRSSPDSELLQRELLARIDQAQFEPAVYRGAKVGVYLCGTANFFIKDGKPHLRIFLHQEDEDLLAGRDFVAPQFTFAPGNMDYKGIFYPPDAPWQGRRRVTEAGRQRAGFGHKCTGCIRISAGERVRRLCCWPGAESEFHPRLS